MKNKIDFKALTLMDAYDIAILIEQEACERYREFASLIGARYEGDAGDFFSEMAGFEALHAKSLSERRQKLFGDKEKKVTAAMIWNVEAPEENRPRTYMSVRQAYAVALESEQKAYDFFNQALSQVTDEETRVLFKELREEEAEHKKKLLEKLKSVPEGDGPDLTDDDIDEPPQI